MPGELIIDKISKNCVINCLDGSIKLDEIEIEDKTFTDREIFNILVKLKLENDF